MNETKKVQNTSFALMGWMTNKLKLGTYELLVYALIYSFSKAKGKTYNGSLAYLCSRLHISKSALIKALNGLVEKKYITKNVKYKNNIKYVTYKYSQAKLDELNISMQTADMLHNDRIFINIEDWMVANYKLSGNHLTVFALINSFTENSPQRCFEGNMKYICQRLNISKRTCFRIIERLTEIGYVERIGGYDRKNRKSRYRSISMKEFMQHQNEMFSSENLDIDASDTSTIANYQDKGFLNSETAYTDTFQKPYSICNEEVGYEPEEISISEFSAPEDARDNEYYAWLEKTMQENAELCATTLCEDDFIDDELLPENTSCNKESEQVSRKKRERYTAKEKRPVSSFLSEIVSNHVCAISSDTDKQSGSNESALKNNSLISLISMLLAQLKTGTSEYDCLIESKKSEGTCVFTLRIPQKKICLTG